MGVQTMCKPLPSDSNPSTSSYQKPYRRKSYNSYSRNGCILCKKAHVKCTEEKPECFRCVRMNLECEYGDNIRNNIIKISSARNLSQSTNFTTNNSNHLIHSHSTNNLHQHHNNNNIHTNKKSYSSRQGIKFVNKSNFISKRINHHEFLKNWFEKESKDDTILEDNYYKRNYPSLKNLLENKPRSSSDSGLNYSDINDNKRQTYFNVFTFFVQSDLNLLKLLNFDFDQRTSSITLSNTSDLSTVKVAIDSSFDCSTETYKSDIENLIKTTFKTTCDDLNKEDMLDDKKKSLHLLLENDPIANIIKNMNGNTKDVLNTLNLDDVILMKYCWRTFAYFIANGTFKCTLPSVFSNYISNLKSILIKSTELQQAMRYIVSTFLKAEYTKSNQLELAASWDRYVRLPTLEVCLKFANDYVQNLSSSEDYLFLVLFSAILFKGNKFGGNPTWRLHVREMTRLIRITEDLLDLENQKVSANGIGAPYLYSKTFIGYTELLNWIICDEGGAISSNKSLSFLFAKSSYLPSCLIGKKYNILTGYMITLHPILRSITLEIVKLKAKGINISGFNIILFKFFNKTTSIKQKFNLFGEKILTKLENLSSYNDLQTCLQDIQETNPRLHLILTNCHNVSQLTLEVYIRTFFITPSFENSEKIINLLTSILTIWNSMPETVSTGTVSLWALYIPALISRISHHETLFNGFYGILKQYSNSYIFLASRLIGKLDALNKMIKENKIEHLTEYECDFPIS
ncbi:hypothetical protein TBLA_0B07050 [Henningerozyma blattae CBS 6284]|uniref:Zn(2)-C6 fungal-type domain-containing protein n=1 Tax=Henningerozyma blattae (strain ATCC 34711 / CBS 6284 / DSM 70876 / NBRC 10599 / NRRL Y-10934 / UCD 77-7) TaxID=1071380 RepID=I2GZH2_HENB6|nr:hypothetical protein TBLA_0B07050 [Tetrapisispora blattae CBS 6284]CCH59524.1 hypothetical protein TBLA_0B07050 [Tetrapisispora blattae CBS 6284]